jgi:hypothetical protein
MVGSQPGIREIVGETEKMKFQLIGTNGNTVITVALVAALTASALSEKHAAPHPFEDNSGGTPPALQVTMNGTVAMPIR